MPHAPCAIRWAKAILSASHWFCQRAGFCAATVFVWLFFWLKYGWHRIYYRQSSPCLFCEIVWLQPDLFLSLASIFLLFVKIDGVSNCEFRLTPPENVFNWRWGCNIIYFSDQVISVKEPLPGFGLRIWALVPPLQFLQFLQ
jgi:hypothetical protein